MLHTNTPFVAIRFKNWLRHLYQSAARMAAGPIFGGWGKKDWDRSDIRRRMQWGAVAAPTAIGFAVGQPGIGFGLSSSAMQNYAGQANQEDILQQQEEYQSQQAAAAEAANTMNTQRDLSGVAASPAYLRTNLPTQAATPQYPMPYPDVPLQYPQQGQVNPYNKAGDMFRNIFRRQY